MPLVEEGFETFLSELEDVLESDPLQVGQEVWLTLERDDTGGFIWNEPKTNTDELEEEALELGRAFVEAQAVARAKAKANPSAPRDPILKVMLVEHRIAHGIVFDGGDATYQARVHWHLRVVENPIPWIVVLAAISVLALGTAGWVIIQNKELVEAVEKASGELKSLSNTLTRNVLLLAGAGVGIWYLVRRK